MNSLEYVCLEGQQFLVGCKLFSKNEPSPSICLYTHVLLRSLPTYTKILNINYKIVPILLYIS